MHILITGSTDGFGKFAAIRFAKKGTLNFTTSIRL